MLSVNIEQILCCALSEILHLKFYGESKMNLCHHDGDQPLVDSLSLSHKVCQGAQPSFPRSWRAQEEALSASWRSALVDPFVTMPWTVQEGALPSSWNFAKEPTWFNHLYVHVCVMLIFVFWRVRVCLLLRVKIESNGTPTYTARMYISYLVYILFDHN